MFVYNNTTRLINLGAKMPLLPGENEITPEQARFMQKFNLDAYIKGKDPWLTISNERIKQEVEDSSVVEEAAQRLRAFVEDGGDKIMDATEGVPEEEGNDLAAKIAARTGAK